MNFNRLLGPGRVNRLALLALCVMTAGSLAAGCGGDDSGATKSAKASKQKDASEPQDPYGAAPSNEKTTTAPDSRFDAMPNAVVTSKTTAPINLKYDLLTKPEPGQPFEIVLAVQPQRAADSLEVEVTDMPGLAIIGERAVSFAAVAYGETYETRVMVQANEPGLYYVSVIAKLVTKVQSEFRAFSIPVVVGTAPAAVQKPAPQQDASGQPIESMPAKEG